MIILKPSRDSSSTVAVAYVVGTQTSGVRRSQRSAKRATSSAVDWFEWIRIASAPASAYARPRRSASSRPHPAIRASVRAMIVKSCDRASTAARIFSACSSVSASSRFTPG